MAVEIDPALDGEVGSITVVQLDGVDYQLRLFWLAEETNTPWSGADPGNLLSATVGDGGAYVGADGDYMATQTGSSGPGAGAVFTVTLASGELVNPVTIVEGGAGFTVLDTISVAVAGVTENTPATIVAVLCESTPGVWICDLRSADGTALVIGQVLRHGADILAGMTTIPGVPQGSLLAIDKSGNSRDPGRADLDPGSDVRLVYRTAEEVGRA